MFLFRILLFPIAVLYDLATRIRNHLYDKGLKPVATFEVPLISVGNLTIGGTGKTPMVEYLIRLLQPHTMVATLSRGYGRTTKGFRIGSKSDDASSLGDEPYQFYSKFSENVAVAVGEDRALAVPYILDRFPHTGVIILDDAFQHRRVKPELSLLLTDYNRPFYKDLILPAGNLRESKNNASRADAVVITKCPSSISEDEMMAIEGQVRKYAAKPVFFTKIRYGEPVAFGRVQECGQRVVLVTGIADANPIKNYIAKKFTLLKHFEWRDHHSYSEADMRKITESIKSNPGTVIATTEKDMVKMNTTRFKAILDEFPFFFIPIEIAFLKNQADFDALVTNVLHKDQAELK